MGTRLRILVGLENIEQRALLFSKRTWRDILTQRYIPLGANHNELQNQTDTTPCPDLGIAEGREEHNQS